MLMNMSKSDIKGAPYFVKNNANIILICTILMRTFYKLSNICFFHKCINKPLSEDKKVPRTLFEATQVAGSATYRQGQAV